MKTKHRSRVAPHIAAIFWALLGTFAFSLLLALGRFYGAESKTPALEVVFLRYLGGLATMLFLTGTRRFSSFHWHGLKAFRGHVYRALAGSLGVVCSLYAASNMPFTDATAIGLTQGLLVMLLATAFLGERLSRLQWVAAIACAGGAAIVVFGKGGFHLPSPSYVVPTLVGLAGALLVAAEVVLIRTLAVRDPASTVLLYVNALACLFLALPVIWLWTPVSAGEALRLIALGPLAIAAQYFNIRAFRLAPASLLGPVGHSRLLFAALLGYFFFAEDPDASTWIGGFVLIVSGFVLAKSHPRSRSA